MKWQQVLLNLKQNTEQRKCSHHLSISLHSPVNHLPLLLELIVLFWLCFSCNWILSSHMQKLSQNSLTFFLLTLVSVYIFVPWLLSCVVTHGSVVKSEDKPFVDLLENEQNKHRI